jgi:hypothetical protein
MGNIAYPLGEHCVVVFATRTTSVVRTMIVMADWANYFGVFHVLYLTTNLPHPNPFVDAHSIFLFAKFRFWEQEIRFWE